jgi:hypothetical protein
MAESNMIDIIQGIAQAVANAKAYPGSTYKGRTLEPKIGLKKDEDPFDMTKNLYIRDRRLHDGFSVKFGDDHLCIVYQSDIELKELYDSGKYEDEMERVMKDIASFLKKEYKAVTGNTLTLTPTDDIDVLVQSTSNVRSFVNVVKYFKIGGVDSTAEEERTIDAKFQKFLDQGGWKKASSTGKD